MRIRSALGALLLALAVLLPRGAAGQYPPVVTRSHLDPNKGVNFHAVVLPDTVYVGQQATYQIGVFLNQEVRQRLRRNPEFVPPETRSLLVYDLPDAKAPLVGTIDGRPYEVHVFQRAFFALSPGEYEIPPSKLTYSLPQSASFFSREESHTMRSEARSLVVLPIPSAGRPADWGGAVGDWRVRLRVDSSRGRVGNPLVVTMRVEGRGNVTLLPRPRLNVPWGSVVAADERVDLDSTPSTLRGAKEFDWLVTPRDAGAQHIAPQRYSYFDPVARRYEVALTPAVDIVVQSGDAVSADSVPPVATPPEPPAALPPAVALRTDVGATVSHAWLRAPWYLALLLLAPVPALVGVIRRRPRRAPRGQTPLERLHQAAVDASRDTVLVRRLTHDALRARLGIDVGLALADGSLVGALRHEGVTVETARRLETMLHLLDAASFGHASAAPPSAGELEAICAAVAAEARTSRTPSGARLGAVVALLVLASASGALARQDDVLTRSWAAGQTAFASRDFTQAERHFLDATRVDPHRPNAWFNVATVAWLAGDTARAVQGWQRALRLEPLDGTVRDRLAQVRAVQDRGPARVPAMPVQLPSMALLVLWLGGWSVLARRAWHRRPIAARAAGLIVLCAAIAAAATWHEAIGRARDFVVVVRPEPLRALPVLGSEAGPAPLTGEVAHVLQRQGAWARVELEGRRQGWIAAELLLPLGDD